MDDFPKLESLSRVQQEVVDKLSTLLQEGSPSLASILEQRSRWNMTVPISRLPPEILLEIFEALAAAVASLPPRGTTDVSKNPYTWIRSTHVCRYWRDLALRTPSLWKRITPACDECMETMVGRAGTHTPLSICLEHRQWLPNGTISQPKVTPYIFSLFCDIWTVFHRIDSLEMPVWQEFPRGDVSIPELTTLVLNGAYVAEPGLSGYADDPLFHPDGLPMLRRLVVRLGSPSTTWSVFRPTLEVLEVDSLVEPPSVSEWLLALSEMPRLRKLSIVEAIEESDHMDASELNDAPVALLHLDDLRIEDSGAGKAALLLIDHIRTEKVHKVAIEASLSDEDGSSDREHAMDLVGSLNSWRDNKHHVMLSIKTMDRHTRARIFVEILAVPLKPKTEPPTSLEPYHQHLTLQVNDCDCSSVLLSLLYLLPTERVLKVAIDVHFNADLLNPFFQTKEFPELRIFELIGKTTPSILDLVNPHPPPPTTHDLETPTELMAECKTLIAGTPKPELAVLFPRLSTLLLVDVPWTGSDATSDTVVLFNQMIQFLWLRRRCTKRPLGKVTIYGSRNLTAADIERLREKKVAKVVEWRGPDDKAFQNVSERWRWDWLSQKSRRQEMLLDLQTRWLKDLRRAREDAFMEDDVEDEDGWDDSEESEEEGEENDSEDEQTADDSEEEASDSDPDE